MPNQAAALDLAFHALADPTRRAILARLAKRPASVSEVHDPRAMALPTLLQHIRVLERSGLIATRKTGRIRTCEIRAGALRATEDWIAKQRSVWEARLDRHDAYVTRMNRREANRAQRKKQARS